MSATGGSADSGAIGSLCRANQCRLTEELLLLPDSHDRLAHIVDRARRRPPLEDAVRIEAFEVEGCTSRLWLVPEVRDGRCWFRLQAESPIVHGLAIILGDIFGGATPRDILSTPLTILDDTRLRQHLSPSRQRGIEILESRIREEARRAEATGHSP